MKTIRSRVNWKTLRVTKNILRKLKPYTGRKKEKVLVLGCQRSGTTLLMDVFEKDFRTIVFREEGSVFRDDHSLRLKDISTVNRILDNSLSQLMVIKPLLDSQVYSSLLKLIPNSKVIWIYRNYKAVASSNLKKFGLGNGIKDLTPIAMDNVKDWRAEGLSPETVKLIKQHYTSDMNPYDAAALFWYARNIIFYEQQLEQNSTVTLCQYEELVSQPKTTIKNLYNFIGVDYTTDRIINEIHTNSKGKGREIGISEEVDKLCSDLLKKLDAQHKKYDWNNA